MQPHAKGVYSDNVSCAAGPSTIVSDTIQGDAEGAEVEVFVSEAFATADSATLTIKFKQCATVGGSYTDVLLTRAYSASELAKSGVEPLLRFSVPKGLQAFTELTYTIGTGTFSAGKIHAHLVNRSI
jgi:hypothetical protein